MKALDQRLTELEDAHQLRELHREAEQLAEQHGIPVEELLALADEIVARNARFRRERGREMTRHEQIARIAAEQGVSEAEVSATLEQIEAEQRERRHDRR